MALTDPLGDMLTILRNATRARHETASVRRSRLNASVLSVLKKERFIYDYKPVEEGAQGSLRVYLRIPEGVDARRLRRIVDVQRVSRPGLRRYTKSDEVPRVLNGLGVNVLSTPKGVMSGREAKKQRVGGEILLKIW